MIATLPVRQSKRVIASEEIRSCERVIASKAKQFVIASEAKQQNPAYRLVAFYMSDTLTGV